VPLFRDYIETDKGLSALHSLAKDGMTAWDCSSDQLNSLADAFADISFKALSVAALEHFAATANEKIEFAKKASSAQPAAAIQSPISADAQATHNNVAATPSRPGGRPHFRRLTP
jgi:hypothetical protein